MANGMSRAVETIIGFLIPPACREEVLGDLYERNATWPRFCLDAARTIPMIIFSRIRRSGELQFILLQAVIAYLCYSAAAWLDASELLGSSEGLKRLAIPAAVVVLAIVFEDAYAKPNLRVPVLVVRGPAFGLILTFVAQGLLWLRGSALTLPLTVLLYGSALSLLLTSALRLWFSPQSTSRQGPQSQ